MIARRLLVVALMLLMGGLATGAAQGQPGETSALAAAVDRLGAYDFTARTEAARALRRASAPDAIKVLEPAARAHRDSYVRFRALVLLTTFGDAIADRVMRDLIADENDRVRTAAYQWFERHPDPRVLPQLLAALAREQSEFVRPALTRAVAGHLPDARARAALLPLVVRGEDLFRGAVIIALGDYKAAFAVPAILDVARRDGPLQDDALTALAAIGDRTVLPALTAMRSAVPPAILPTVRAASCLLGAACDVEERQLREAFAYAVAGDDAALLRGVVHGLGMLAAGGQRWAIDRLMDAGGTDVERVRAPVALAIGGLVLRQPRLALEAVERRGVARADLELLRDAFDMLSEEFDEEQCYAEWRREFWAAPEGSPRRRAAGLVMAALEF